jgi:sporulation-control protein spo0M
MNIFNRLIGGGGNMQLQLYNTEVKRGQSLTATVLLNCTSELKGRSINLEIKSVEQIHLDAPVASTVSSQNDGITIGGTQTTARTIINQIYHNLIVLDANPGVMQKGESKQFTATFTIPVNMPATYIGKDARHTWQIRAFLDIPMAVDIDVSSVITVL